MLNVILYFADTEIYGPYEIHSIEELPKAAGFGGTSFVPFFNYLEKEDPIIFSVKTKPQFI